MPRTDRQTDADERFTPVTLVIVSIDQLVELIVDFLNSSSVLTV